jgi:hypothetical protein
MQADMKISFERLEEHGFWRDKQRLYKTQFKRSTNVFEKSVERLLYR